MWMRDRLGYVSIYDSVEFAGSGRIERAAQKIRSTTVLTVIQEPFTLKDRRKCMDVVGTVVQPVHGRKRQGRKGCCKLMSLPSEL